jgi:membrane-bound ClpP family serine protease
MPADAATFQRIDLPGAPGGGILLTGVIDLGDQTAFEAVAADMRAAVVVTTGPGGSVDAAIKIGTDIRNRGWTTLVPPGAYCASACSMIWLAGARRLIADDGKIGFHAISVRPGGVVTETHEFDFALREWLNALGYTEDTTATIVNTPSALVRWLDALELRANGIDCDTYTPAARQ